MPPSCVATRRYKTLGPGLLKRLADLDADANELFSLREELMHIRATYMDALDQYSTALDMYQLALANGDEKVIGKAITVRDAAAQQLRDVNRQVREAALDAARIEQMSDKSFSPAAVREIVAQCVRAMYQVCSAIPQGDEVAVEFERLIRDTIRVQDMVTGTTITPSAIDADVTEMDDTIPRN